jgi:peptidylprolyl isomerase
MSMHRLLPFAALILTGAAQPAQETPKFETPGDVLTASAKSDWATIPADRLLVMDLASGSRVVVQLASEFAPVHVANIQALARADYWSGAKIYRVQDNYVAQWGNNESEKPLPAGVVKVPPAEYHRSLKGLSIVPLGSPDAYAPAAGYVHGWPVAYDPKNGTANLTHCYGSVGVGRDMSPDTGMGGELYAAIGHAPRHLDRNIAIVGRVVSGMEALASLPRGTEALGFYKDRSQDAPIARVRLASSIDANQRPSFEYLREDSASFARWLKVKKNRRDAFYIRPAGGVDLCNAPVPVRPAG